MTTSKSLAKLLEVLENKYKDPEKVVEKFWVYAKHKNLIYKLPNVLRHLERKADARKDTFVALAVSHDVSTETENKIRKFMGVSEAVPIEKKVDPKLMGGFIAEHNNLIYDGSLDRQLKKLKEVLLQN